MFAHGRMQQRAEDMGSRTEREDKANTMTSMPDSWRRPTRIQRSAPRLWSTWLCHHCALLLPFSYTHTGMPVTSRAVTLHF